MTKAFTFSLQKVLDVREVMEESKAMDLQKAQADTELKKQRLLETQAEKAALVSPESKAEVDSDVKLTDLNTRTAYLGQLRAKIAEQNQDVAQSKAEEEVKRQAYVEASKDKKVMERLKEKHRDKFKKKQNQEAVKEESEVAGRMSANREVGL